VGGVKVAEVGNNHLVVVVFLAYAVSGVKNEKLRPIPF
jgi:hypothetical protein